MPHRSRTYHVAFLCLAIFAGGLFFVKHGHHVFGYRPDHFSGLKVNSIRLSSYSIPRQYEIIKGPEADAVVAALSKAGSTPFELWDTPPDPSGRRIESGMVSMVIEAAYGVRYSADFYVVTDPDFLAFMPAPGLLTLDPSWFYLRVSPDDRAAVESIFGFAREQPEPVVRPDGS